MRLEEIREDSGDHVRLDQDRQVYSVLGLILSTSYNKRPSFAVAAQSQASHYFVFMLFHTDLSGGYGAAFDPEVYIVSIALYLVEL